MSTGEAQEPIDLRLNADGVAVAVWTWDLVTSELSWSPGLGPIFGMDLSKVSPDTKLYKSLVHPDDQIDLDGDRDVVARRILECQGFRIVRPNGALRWLYCKTRAHLDGNGGIGMLVGSIEDVTSDVERAP